MRRRKCTEARKPLPPLARVVGICFRHSLYLCAGLALLIGLSGSVIAGAVMNPPVIAAASMYTWGSSGDTVRMIQEKLKRAGYYEGSVDGIYGYRTYEAVLHLQQANGLKEDGIAGSQTLDALEIAVPEPEPYDLGAIGAIDSTPSLAAEPVNASAGRENDVWLLAGVIHGEARGELYTGQVAVGAVILNRVNNPSFPNTIAGVVYQPGAFDAVSDGQSAQTPNESCIRAARDALNGWDPTNNALYYWNPKKATNQWVLSIPVTTVIGNHHFGVR